MTRRPSSRRPVRAVLALTVAAASLVGAAQASAAPAAAVTYAVTGVAPAYVEADVDDAFGITLTGKGFTRKTRVKFGSCPDGKAVAPSTLTATKLVVQPPSCAAGPQPITVSEDGVTPAQSSTLTGKFTFLAKPVVLALAPATSAVAPAAGPWSGGTAATVTVKDAVPAKAAVQVLLTAAGATKAVPGKVDAANARKIAFKVPAGVPGQQPSIVVSVLGIASDPVDELFTWQSTIKTSPNAWVKGAPAPAVKIDGAGFTAAATVTICDKPAALVAGKATAKTLVVTPPAWNDVLTDAAAQAAGGVCTVEVTVGTVTSAVTAGSTFTYAAY